MPRFDGRFFPSSQVADWASGKFGTPGWYPAAPTGVTPTEGDQEVALAWTEGNTHGADITGYKVEKNDGSSWSTATSDTGSGTTSYTVTGLTNATAYTFRVTAINSVGLGETVSSVSAASTPRGVPGAPGTLSLSAGDPAPNVIGLSWSAGSTNGGAITGYKIQRSTDGSSWSNVVADTGSTGTTYSNTGLTASTAYHYRVAAINAAGVGGYGNEPTRTTAAPFLSWSATGSYSSGTDGSYSWVRWTSSGTFVITANPNSRTFDQHITAGGGGGCGYDGAHGGGGGGGSKQFTGQTMGNATHTITIGAGGAGSRYAAAGTDGSDSVCGSNSTEGGGGGGGGNGRDGGSGGGGGDQGSGTMPGGDGNAGEGHDGGNGQSGYFPISGGGGGGGGAGAAGGVGYSCHGGIGTTMTYTSTDYEVAGGGGSAVRDWYGSWYVKKGGGTDGNGTGNDTTNAANQKYGAGNFSQNTNPYGGTNTGGGGGCHGRHNTSLWGGTGGSGVVELRWLT